MRVPEMAEVFLAVIENCILPDQIMINELKDSSTDALRKANPDRCIEEGRILRSFPTSAVTCKDGHNL